MLMGFVGLPISLALYWVMLRCKKESPFPRGGLISLLIAALVSVIVSSILSMPISIAAAIIRSGALSDVSGLIELINNDPEAFKAMIETNTGSPLAMTVRAVIEMFFSAALLEEGLKYLTCRIAIRKKGMIRTWMDSVVAFAIVGITFELLENIAFGADSDILNAFLRALASAHFVFGVIMGYYYGKYLVTGKKRYHLLSFFVPVIYHSLGNGFMSTMELSTINYVLGVVFSISFIITAVLAVIIVLRWQKNKTLDVPIEK